VQTELHFICLTGNFRKASLGQIGLQNGSLHEKGGKSLI